MAATGPLRRSYPGADDVFTVERSVQGETLTITVFHHASLETKRVCCQTSMDIRADAGLDAEIRCLTAMNITIEQRHLALKTKAQK